MNNFATIDDVKALYRADLSQAQTVKAIALLPIVSNMLRTRADNAGVDIDLKAAKSTAYADTLKKVTVDIVGREALQTPNEDPALSQFSISAGGYTQSGTYASPGGGIFIKKSELKILGILQPKYGTIDFAPERRDADYD